MYSICSRVCCIHLWYGPIWICAHLLVFYIYVYLSASHVSPEGCISLSRSMSVCVFDPICVYVLTISCENVKLAYVPECLCLCLCLSVTKSVCVGLIVSVSVWVSL